MTTTLNMSVVFKPMEEISFSYRDEAGEYSERTITVEKVTDTYVVGYCHARMDYRTFRYSRIILVG